MIFLAQFIKIITENPCQLQALCCWVLVLFMLSVEVCLLVTKDSYFVPEFLGSAYSSLQSQILLYVFSLGSVCWINIFKVIYIMESFFLSLSTMVSHFPRYISLVWLSLSFKTWNSLFGFFWPSKSPLRNELLFWWVFLYMWLMSFSSCRFQYIFFVLNV